MKKIKTSLTIIFLLSFISGYCFERDYAVNKVPADLLKNANVVKRFEETRFEVVDMSKAKLYHTIALTILNEKGDKYADFMESYDKLHSIEYIEGNLYDSDGKKIKSLKKSDIQDLSGTNDISLADDNRLKHHNFYHKIYPYTIEYETEVKYYYTLFYPAWIPQEDENYSVESSKISISCPQNISFRFKAFNYTAQPVISNEKDTKIYTWEIKNLNAIQEEYASPNWYEITPVVCMGPVQFKVDDYEGNMSSWQDFGKFVYALKNGRDQLPSSIKKVVHQLTDSITSTKNKIELLYDFMQKNTRYISIQLGIGGWQPFDATYVSAKRYGDCKALSNYMYSLLKEAGIKSYYTLIKAGDDNHFFINDFPSSQFNHVIVCVPVLKDTVWLECTSQTMPAGYLGAFTSDRTALLIDETGGTLVHTPKYGLQQNLQNRKTIATIDADGNLSANISTRYQAIEQDNLHQLITGYSKDKVLEYLKEEIDLPNYDVVKFDYKPEPGAIPVISETLDITANNYAQVSGKRLFITPNILSKRQGKLLPDDSRKFDLNLTHEYKRVDTTEIKVPLNYKPEAMPESVSIHTKFGNYNSSAKIEGDKIFYYRTMEQYSGRFPATEYNNLVNFYDQIYRSDRSKVVLKKDE